MTTSKKVRRFSLRFGHPGDSGRTEGARDREEEGGGDRKTMFDVASGKTRENMQRVIVVARLPRDLADRTELGAHYENLNIQLSKQYKWDHITGLLLIYRSCLLHVFESCRDIRISVLKDLIVMQQQPDCTLLEARIVFLEHAPQSRMFPQWSYKVLDADKVAGDAGFKRLNEDEERVETLICSALSALQKLGEHLELSKKALPGRVLDENLELIIPQSILEKLLDEDDLLTPQQYVELYKSPLKINMEFGEVHLRNLFSNL